MMIKEDNTMKRLLIFPLCACLFAATGALAQEKQMKITKQTLKVEITDTPVDMISGIIYSQILTPQNRALHMTLLTPCTEGPKPAVVFYPGGGFTTANHEQFLDMRMALAKAGFVVAAAEYRTVPDRFPALICDAKSAIRYLRAHADQFGIDPQRIGVLGASAGGYVVQMLGTTNGEHRFDVGDNLNQSSDVQAVATIYGISNLLNIGEGFSDEVQKIHHSPVSTESLLLYGPAFADYAGHSIMDDPQKALDASPIGHVKEHMPPFLIMHGSADNLVSPKQSEQIYQALVSKGNRADYVEVEGAGHGDLSWYQPTLIQKVVDWFKQTLMTDAPSR